MAHKIVIADQTFPSFTAARRYHDALMNDSSRYTYFVCPDCWHDLKERKRPLTEGNTGDYAIDWACPRCGFTENHGSNRQCLVIHSGPENEIVPGPFPFRITELHIPDGPQDHEN